LTTTTYAADRSALLIVDPYNDFMSEGGKFYEATRETAEVVGCSAALSAKLFIAGAADEGGLCGGSPAPAMNNFGDGIRERRGWLLELPKSASFRRIRSSPPDAPSLSW
jgi:hypothetical protein